MTARRLTAKRVRELLDCDPETGTLRWKERPGQRSFNTRLAGKLAGLYCPRDGYWRVRIDGRLYLSHRVVFLHVKGYWPPAFLDHSDGNRQNRAIENLRPASVQQNNQNLSRRSKKGYPRGCWRDPKAGRWQVHIQAFNKRICVGWFNSEAAAARAYLDASATLHGTFPLASGLLLSPSGVPQHDTGTSVDGLARSPDCHLEPLGTHAIALKTRRRLSAVTRTSGRASRQPQWRPSFGRASGSSRTLSASTGMSWMGQRSAVSGAITGHSGRLSLKSSPQCWRSSRPSCQGCRRGCTS
jgi:hypothetical protein